MFDEEKAKRTVDFINCLKHTKGKWRGQPFDLLPWQEAIIRDVFGTVKENGYRQYNTAYVEIPKKNGKSELAAGVALYMTCGDNEWGAEVYGCASDRQQASIVFDVAVDMVEQCPALKKRIKPVMSVKRLVYKPTNSFYQVLSAEAYTKHGLNVHAVIFDELHSQPNRELFDVMTKGSGDARTQPLFFLITTAGTDRHSVCFEQHQKAEDILQGRKIDPTFYPVIYGASDDADWSSEDVWKKANPSLGHTIDIEKVRNAYLSAKDNPAEENIFRQLRLNQWVKQSTRWMQMEKWDACAFPVDEREVLGRECYGGLDLSSSIDITAFVLVFPPRNDTEKYILLPYFWIPEENMRLRVRRDHVPYDVWERQGYLQTTAVYSCVRILAEAVASLPIHVYRYTDTGKERVYDHPLYYLLHDEPNPEMTSFVFRETLMSHLLIWGNAYAQVIRDGSGRVLSLYPLLPDKMEVDRDEHGRLFYTYTRNTNENPNFSEYGRVRLQPEDVLHIPGLGFDGLVGYSPIAMAKNAVGMTLACEEYGASFFENGATPGGVLEHPGVLKDPAKVRESWHAAYGGSRNAGKVAVL